MAAQFIGTKKEFRKYIGPRLRNLVNTITKEYKSSVSACQHCKSSKKNLEAAHVHGKSRNDIIDIVLNEFKHTATVDLANFEKRFIKKHDPLEKSILVLCKECHKKYDKKTLKSAKENKSYSATRHNKDCLPITLEPSNPEVFKQELLHTKQALIEETYKDGIKKKNWKASKFSNNSNIFGNLRSRPNYRPGNWQKKGIIKVHVKVIKKSLQDKDNE